MTSTSPLSALTIDTNSEAAFGPGDVAVIMKADGTTRAVSVGIDSARLRLLEEEDYSDADRLALSQARKLLAVTVALGNPQIMQILFAMIDDPAVASGLADAAKRH